MIRSGWVYKAVTLLIIINQKPNFQSNFQKFDESHTVQATSNYDSFFGSLELNGKK